MKRTIYLFSMVFSTLFMSCNIEPLSELPEPNSRIYFEPRRYYIEEIDEYKDVIPSDGGWVSVELTCYDAPLEGIYAEVDNKTDWISSVYMDETYEKHSSGIYGFVVRFFVDKSEKNVMRSGDICFYSNKNDRYIEYITIKQDRIY